MSPEEINKKVAAPNAQSLNSALLDEESFANASMKISHNNSMA